jgi:hypothetical protein
MNAYYRFTGSSPRLTSGSPTSPLNVVRSNLVGARIDAALGFGIEFTVGGGFEYENRRETLTPYQRNSYDAYVETAEPFLGRGRIRLTMRKTLVDYEDALHDVDLTGYDLKLWTRHPLGIDLSADASYEEDVGGGVPRSRTRASLKAQWRYRRVSLTADLGQWYESQAGVDRRNTRVQVFLRRDIGP